MIEQARLTVLKKYRAKRRRGFTPYQAIIGIEADYSVRYSADTAHEARRAAYRDYAGKVLERILAPDLLGAYWHHGQTREVRLRGSQGREEAL
jgi:hypothetical protein